MSFFKWVLNHYVPNEKNEFELDFIEDIRNDEVYPFPRVSSKTHIMRYLVRLKTAKVYLKVFENIYIHYDIYVNLQKELKTTFTQRKNCHRQVVVV
jgi:uncharacterized protein YozE (UPF0346 family)